MDIGPQVFDVYEGEIRGIHILCHAIGWGPLLFVTKGGWVVFGARYHISKQLDI